MGAGSSKSLDDSLRENKRYINRAIRELEREKSRLDQSEQQMINEIKQCAAKGQISAVKIMAKDLVRTKKYKNKFILMKTQMQAINLRLQTIKSTQTMSESMKSIGSIMIKMNKQLNLASLQKIVQDFMRENEKMNFTEDMMNDVVDDAFADDIDEEEEEKIVSSVLDEIGVDLHSTVASAPSTTFTKSLPASGAKHVEHEGVLEGGNSAAGGGAGAGGNSLSEIEKSLEERLNNLKK